MYFSKFVKASVPWRVYTPLVLKGLKTNMLFIWLCRSSHQKCSAINGLLQNFANFTAKHLCWSLFFSSPPEVFLGKGVLKICSKLTGEPMPNSKQIYWNHTSDGRSRVNLLHIYRTSFSRNTSEGLLLKFCLTIL